MNLVFGTMFVAALAFWVVLWQLTQWAVDKFISKLKGSN